MIIEIHPPHALNEIGQRESNEDSIYPPLSDQEAQAASKIFLVCDGVGGAERGEEASRLACKTFSEFLRPIGDVQPADIEQALLRTEENMDAYIRQHPEAEGMATTLTLVTFNRQGALIAHIGDSRVYQVRLGEVLFKTADHSFVGELLANNIITEEQAASHPKRNVVSRAIMGSQRPTKVEVKSISDVRIGDYFFLCSDGILESVNDARLTEILRENKVSDQYKLSQIQTLCQHGSRDNFSAYLLKVKSVIKDASAASPRAEGDAAPNPGKRKSRIAVFFTVAALFTVTLIAVVILLQNRQQEIPVEEPAVRPDTADIWWTVDSARAGLINPDSTGKRADSLSTIVPGSVVDTTKSKTGQ